MAASGTYAYAPTFDDLIVEAWERCGKHEQSIDGSKLRSAKRSLQLMLIDWTARGLNLWQVDSQTVSLTSGVSTVTLAYPTIDVLEAYVTISTNNDRILASISRDEYAAIPNKALKAPPNQYWSERLINAPVLHLFPVPDAAYTMSYSRIRMPQDVSAFTQTPDAPVLWAEALVSELAARLAVKFASDRVQLLRPDADRAFMVASADNRERTPLRIMPSMDGY